MINLVTLFTGGLSAIDFALKYESMEYDHLLACEIDKYARKQFLQFHKEPLSFAEDASKVCAKHLKGKVDLYCFGSPCQDLSLAGKRKGFNGKKSSLFREGARVMSEMMPKSFIFENVKGLLSSNNGNDYKEVVKTFQDIGYLIAIKVVNTKDHGIPQNRERVFIVGFLDAEKYHNFYFAEPEPLKLVLRDMLDDNVSDKYYLSDKTIDGFMKHKERHKKRGNGFAFAPKTGDDIANCLSTRAGNRPTDNFIKEPRLEQIGNIDTKGHNSIWGRVYSPDGLSACLNANGGGVGAKTGLYYVKSATTEDYRIRKLTPRECFKLQGVKNKDINLINSDRQSYKIAGNAISVNVMQMILRQVYKAQKPKYSLF